ncbi:MAG: zinc ribbon domain-containing protein [Bdellovibrionota bacterium]
MQSNFIENLIKLGKIDALLTRISAEKKQATKKYVEIDNKLNERAVVLSDKSSLLKSREEKYKKEQKDIKEERQKLVERRKAIYSFNDHRVQQSAQKEVELASKQLDTREERLLPVLEEIEILKKDYDNVLNDCKILKQALDKLQKNKDEVEATYKKRQEEGLQKRDEILKNISKDALTEYNKARSRHPMDPVVNVRQDNLCGGCAMKLGAQTLLQVSREKSAIHCPGCNRILYIKKSDGSDNSQEEKESK